MKDSFIFWVIVFMMVLAFFTNQEVHREPWIVAHKTKEVNMIGIVEGDNRLGTDMIYVIDIYNRVTDSLATEVVDSATWHNYKLGDSYGVSNK